MAVQRREFFRDRFALQRKVEQLEDGVLASVKSPRSRSPRVETPPAPCALDDAPPEDDDYSFLGDWGDFGGGGNEG